LKRLVIAVSLAAIAFGSVVPVAAAKPVAEPGLKSHVLPNPLAERQVRLKNAALEAVLKGQVVPQGKNKKVQLNHDQGAKWVELAFEGEDQILTLLAEFGGGDPVDHPVSHGSHVGDPFAHNSIPEPDRLVDNSTIWTEDFNQSYYDNLLYNKDQYPSMANFYLEQSSGQYSVNGEVWDWVTVPNNPTAYGSNYCGDIVCTDTWRFVNDQADAFFADAAADLGSTAAVNAWLAPFDVWDRYDWDGDGDFDEPDGYIDHFQSVHAGEGEETGGGALGADAIWSHRWYAYYPGSGITPPDGAGPHGLQGVKIGASDYWIGDYTVEPENGGVGVFAHEFAHDLDLPDLYDTSGNTGGAENSTGWWTVMSQGSYGDQSSLSIGEYPTHFSLWEKYFLGFLENYTVITNTTSGTYTIGPAEYNSNKPQGMIVVLPDKETFTDVGDPYEGSNFYYSGTADGFNTEMHKSVTLPAGTPSMSFQAFWDIEEDFDYAYVAVNGTTVPTSVSNSSVDPNGIDGSQATWTAVTVDLTAYAGMTVDLAIGYLTDSFVQGNGGSVAPGFRADAISISGQPFDGAEADAGWTFDSTNEDFGFHVTNGSESSFWFNAYFIEMRRHMGYDDSLRRGPYNFGFPDDPNFVEHFRYEPGVVVWYYDESTPDNSVGDHPGSGLLLPVDAHPNIMTWKDGTQVRPRIQAYDSPFTIAKTRKITLHNPADGVAKTFPSRPGVRVFNDSNNYWLSGHPSDAASDGRYQAEWNSVDVPSTGFDFYIKKMTPYKAVLKVNLP
jgi:immune inhibitor A